MPSAGDLASRMIAALHLAEPNLDTSIGTPLRKILDVVAESMAEMSTDGHLIDYQYDIDSKIGGDLDDFVALFGFQRIGAQRAQGTVTFSRPNDSTAATQAQVVSPGTQVVALTNPIVYVTTTVSAVLSPGQLSVEVPVQAVLAGPSGNVGASLLTTPASAVPGITSMTNTQALTGGAPQESDEQLRARFRQTVFRSLAGTQAMYEGIARDILQDPALVSSRAVSKVNVIGSSKRWREQLAIVGGTANSTVPNAAYIYPDNAVVGSNIDGGAILVPKVDYNLVATNPTNRTNASLVVNSASAAMPNGLYDVDIEYVPQYSRNDPAVTRFGTGAVNNRIDVYVNGRIQDTAVQSVVFSNALTFNDTTLNRANFIQGNPANGIPTTGTILIPLSFGPIISVPPTISVGATVYHYQTDYWICWQNDCFGRSPRSLFGLSWNPANKPANGATFSLSYTYNRVARDVQEAVDNWRLVGTDAMVHVGREVPLLFNFAIVYDRRFDPTAVKSAIDTTLANFVSQIGFDTPLQISDVLQVVHNVAGVDNVRMLTSTDDAGRHAVCRMSAYAPDTVTTVYSSGGRAIDVTFAGNEFPIFHSCRVIQKAANNFGQF